MFCPDQQWPSNRSDKTAYNNIYAANSCSVAAPTAGLHFTDKILEQIGDKKFSYLLLHVGAGTFKPLMVQDARDHDMHAEAFSVPVHDLKSMIGAMEAGKPIVAVGTPSSRMLESFFWCGVKKIRGLTNDSGSLSLRQFDGSLSW